MKSHYSKAKIVIEIIKQIKMKKVLVGLLLGMVFVSCSNSDGPRKVSKRMYFEHYANANNYEVVKDGEGLYYAKYLSVQDTLWKSLYDMGTTDFEFAKHISKDLFDQGVEELLDYEEEQRQRDEEEWENQIR